MQRFIDADGVDVEAFDDHAAETDEFGYDAWGGACGGGRGGGEGGVSIIIMV